MAGTSVWPNWSFQDENRFTEEYKQGSGKRLRAQEVGGLKFAVGSCVTTTLGTFFLTFVVGFIAPIYANICSVDADGNCDASCITCDGGKRYGVEEGSYYEYSNLSVFILACTVSVLAFMANLIMGRWSTSALDLTSDWGLIIKNFALGDRSFQPLTAFLNFIGHLAGPLLAVFALWWLSGPDSSHLLLGTFTLRGSGTAGGWSRSIFALCFVAVFNTAFFLWSRVSYLDGSIDEKHIELAALRGDKLLNPVPTVWPELGSHYATALFNGANMFVSALVTCYYAGPLPLNLGYLVWASLFNVAPGKTNDGVDGIGINYPFGTTHFLALILISLIGKVFVSPIILWVYVKLQAINTMYERAVVEKMTSAKQMTKL